MVQLRFGRQLAVNAASVSAAKYRLQGSGTMPIRSQAAAPAAGLASFKISQSARFTEPSKLRSPFIREVRSPIVSPETTFWDNQWETKTFTSAELTRLSPVMSAGLLGLKNAAYLLSRSNTKSPKSAEALSPITAISRSSTKP